jgi:hypothetical protein
MSNATQELKPYNSTEQRDCYAHVTREQLMTYFGIAGSDVEGEQFRSGRDYVQKNEQTRVEVSYDKFSGRFDVVVWH